MAPRKQQKKTIKAIVEKAMPGWTVVDEPKSAPAAADAAAERGASVSPGLGALKAKALKKPAKVVKLDALKKHHGQFVKVKPANMGDNTPAPSKVVIVRDGKIVARQG
jgi:hypothetical protein